MKLQCKINNEIYNLVSGSYFSEEYNETLDSGTIIIDQVGKINDLKPYDDVFIFSGNFNVKQTSDELRKELYVTTKEVENQAKKGLKIEIKDNLDDYKNTPHNEVYVNVETEVNGVIYKAYQLYKYNFNDNSLNFVKTISGDDNEYTRFSAVFIKNEDGTAYAETYQDDINLFEIVKFNVILNAPPVQKPEFYKHLLVSSFVEERLNLNENLYKYKIELFSETKGLETVQLPNISITQPLVERKKKSVAQYIVDYLTMYSPKIKRSTNEKFGLWEYQPKYSYNNDIWDFFSDVYSPDFTLNNPNLRDVLTQLMLVKDCIPVVRDNEINFIDITKRNGVFNTQGTNYITSSRSSENHCSNLKRTYSNALSQDNSCKRIEYLGFRNSNSGLLTIENMRLETSFPIYKINKIYCCYYKKGKIYTTDEISTGKEKIFLCKQDITPLIKLNSERNLLSEDWNDFSNNPPESIVELEKYKLCTLGYNIGDKYIEGWGNKYSFPEGWWQEEKTYFENIITLVDKLNVYGIYDYGYITKMGKLFPDEVFVPDNFLSFVNPFSNNSLGLKSFFFEVEYNSFYNGTVIHSKDSQNDGTTINDNSSSSLTLLEKDGLFQKEKINRFGNIGYQINARYSNINEIQNLGSVYDDDIIIYHREYTIYDNLVNCSYYGTKDYVLKNYYTSVFAKHRTYNLMSYEESVLRAENKKMTLLLSKDKQYTEIFNRNFKIKNVLETKNFDKNDSYSLENILSFIKESPKAQTSNFIIYDRKINYGFVVYDGKMYATDMNAFMSGNSLCFNLQMKDNVSMGVYIDELEPSGKWNDITDDLKGTIQKWYMSVDSVETGKIEKIGFYVAHVDLSDFVKDNVVLDGSEENNIKSNIFDKIFKFPLIENLETNFVIGDEFVVNKDNKEVLDLTYQIEPISDSEDVLFSQWMLKLSDLLSTHNKVQKTYEAIDVMNYGLSCTVYSSTYVNVDSLTGNIKRYPIIQIKIPRSFINELKVDTSFNTTLSYDKTEKQPGSWFSDVVTKYFADFDKITEIRDDKSYFTLGVKQTFYINKMMFGKEISKQHYQNIDFWLTKTDEDYYYYSNFYITNQGSFENPVNYSQLFTEAGKPVYMNNFLAFNNKEYALFTDFTTSNSQVETVYFSNAETGYKTAYEKNIFVVEDVNPMKKTIVYDEYYSINSLEHKVSDVFTFDEDSINVDLTKISSNAKSVQVWYKDGTKYKFVFGVNLNGETENLKIYASLLSQYNTIVYDDFGNKIGIVMQTNNQDIDKNHQYYRKVKTDE